jgi:hypothetical protein
MLLQQQEAERKFYEMILYVFSVLVIVVERFSSTKRPSGTEGQLAPQNIDEFARLESDLNSVMDKVTMCREMLLVSPGIEEDEILADVIGFLEAVRDRMGELIDAGTQGVLGEELFALCLKVNEAVYRTLEAERVSTWGI